MYGRWRKHHNEESTGIATYKALTNKKIRESRLAIESHTTKGIVDAIIASNSTAITYDEDDTKIVSGFFNGSGRKY